MTLDYTKAISYNLFSAVFQKFTIAVVRRYLSTYKF